jgi:hypothetical protein
MSRWCMNWWWCSRVISACAVVLLRKMDFCCSAAGKVWFCLLPLRFYEGKSRSNAAAESRQHVLSSINFSSCSTFLVQ